MCLRTETCLVMVLRHTFVLICLTLRHILKFVIKLGRQKSQCITGQSSKTEVAVLSNHVQVRLVACRNFDIFG